MTAILAFLIPSPRLLVFGRRDCGPWQQSAFRPPPLSSARDRVRGPVAGLRGAPARLVTCMEREGESVRVLIADDHDEPPGILGGSIQ